MASVNKAIILGNLGADPEIRYTQGGAAVCTLSVATSEVRADDQGNKTENVEWHRVIVWNKQAENCAKYLAKGRSVYVEGKIQTRSWEDQNGQKRYSTEIIGQKVQFVGSAPQSTGSSEAYDGQLRHQKSTPAQSFEAPQNRTMTPAELEDPAYDIPF